MSITPGPVGGEFVRGRPVTTASEFIPFTNYPRIGNFYEPTLNPNVITSTYTVTPMRKNRGAMAFPLYAAESVMDEEPTLSFTSLIGSAAEALQPMEFERTRTPAVKTKRETIIKQAKRVRTSNEMDISPTVPLSSLIGIVGGAKDAAMQRLTKPKPRLSPVIPRYKMTDFSDVKVPSNFLERLVSTDDYRKWIASNGAQGRGDVQLDDIVVKVIQDTENRYNVKFSDSVFYDLVSAVEARSSKKGAPINPTAEQKRTYAKWQLEKWTQGGRVPYELM